MYEVEMLGERYRWHPVYKMIEQLDLERNETLKRLVGNVVPLEFVESELKRVCLVLVGQQWLEL